MITLDAASVRLAAALGLIGRYGAAGGAPGKAWIVDQVARILLGDETCYQEWRADFSLGEDWDEGIAPDSSIGHLLRQHEQSAKQQQVAK